METDGNNQIYQDIILQHVRLFGDAIGADFVFMDGNSRLHRASIVDECLEEEDITRLKWLYFFPDLNPIENAWDTLGRQVAARHPPPTSLPELYTALIEERAGLPRTQLDNLAISMLKHCTECLAAHDKHIDC